MTCRVCVLKQPYDHAEPWQCPDCGLRWAVLMPDVRRRSIDLPPPMEPEREEAIELLLCAADAGWFAANRFEDGPSLAMEALKAADVVTAAIAPAWNDIYREAAGLLLDGWNPGDEVVRRPVFDVPSPSEVSAYLNGPSMVSKFPKAARKVAR